MRIVAKTIIVDNTVASWANIAKQYNLTYLQLREANPWIRSTSLTNKGKKAYKVKIPDSKALHYKPAMTKAHNPNWVVK